MTRVTGTRLNLLPFLPLADPQAVIKTAEAILTVAATQRINTGGLVTNREEPSQWELPASSLKRNCRSI